MKPEIDDDRGWICIGKEKMVRVCHANGTPRWLEGDVMPVLMIALLKALGKDRQVRKILKELDFKLEWSR